MRSLLLYLPLSLFTGIGPSSAPACGASALASAPDAWDAETAVTGDLTLDGKPDVVFWKRDEGSVLLFVAVCDGDDVVRSWRYRLPVADDCPPGQVTVEIGSLLIDTALVDRLCANGRPDQCQHLRNENQSRQVLAEKGGRELRIRGPGCAGERFRWSAELGGFMRIAG